MESPSSWWRNYRVVRDGYCGYEVQVKYIWFPIWLQCDFVNTHLTIEKAKLYALGHSNKVVEYL